jgi:hypothetical protein
MSKSEDSLTSSVIVCHYGDTNGVFPIAGMVEIDETPMEAGTHYYRKLINCVQQSNKLSFFTIIDVIKDLTPIRISMYMLDVNIRTLNMTYIT